MPITSTKESTLRDLPRIDARHHVWLVFAMGLVTVVVATYVVTHPHPAYEGGLYLRIVQAIRTHGYGMPNRIPHYTARGVPFAYPPLLFYVTSVVVDVTNVDPVEVMRVVPGVVVVAYLVPYYVLARTLLGSRRQAGLGTLLFGVTPPVLKWHLSAGGIVRAPALLLTLTGLYVGVKLFRTGDRRWIFPATLLFGLTILAHPVYPVFFGLSYLLFAGAYDRSLDGLANGAVVAAGGLVLSAPWWIHVIVTHGPEVFVAASSSRSSIGGGGSRVVAQFVWPFVRGDVLTLFYVLAFAGGIYALVQRTYLLPAWMITASYVIGEQRFTFVAGAMVSALFVFEFVLPAVSNRTSVRRDRAVRIGVLTLVVLGATGAGVAYAGSGLHTAHWSSPSQPQTVDAADRAAMTWVQGHTQPEADVLVLGDAAEWFPYYTDRTILVSPWGTEWTTAERFQQQVILFEMVSTCETLGCLERGLASLDRPPDYLYVPSGEYTVHGEEKAPRSGLVTAMKASDRYDLEYENGDVAIFRRTVPACSDTNREFDNTKATPATVSAACWGVSGLSSPNPDSVDGQLISSKPSLAPR